MGGVVWVNPKPSVPPQQTVECPPQFFFNQPTAAVSEAAFGGTSPLKPNHLSGHWAFFLKSPFTASRNALRKHSIKIIRQSDTFIVQYMLRAFLEARPPTAGGMREKSVNQV